MNTVKILNKVGGAILLSLLLTIVTLVLGYYMDWYLLVTPIGAISSLIGYLTLNLGTILFQLGGDEIKAATVTINNNNSKELSSEISKAKAKELSKKMT